MIDTAPNSCYNNQAVNKIAIEYGGIAQLGERLNGIQEVSGSIPLISTTKSFGNCVFPKLFLLYKILVHWGLLHSGLPTQITLLSSVGGLSEDSGDVPLFSLLDSAFL